MKFAHFFAVGSLFVAASVFAGHQEDPPKSAIAFREYRVKITEPTFGLEKIKGILKKYKAGTEESDSTIPVKVWNSLSTKEKFTYCMLRGEAYAQNCDAVPVNVKEEKVVYANPMVGFNDEHSWSQRQLDWLKANRKTVIRLTRETIKTRQRTGANLRMLILELNAKELIPDVISAYEIKTKDHDALSLVSSMMKEANYGPYTKSKIFPTLYGPDFSYYHSVIYSKSLHEEIKKHGLSFAKTK
jgi:hypothetical protein